MMGLTEMGRRKDSVKEEERKEEERDLSKGRERERRERQGVHTGQAFRRK